MREDKEPKQVPLWVKLGLMGLSGRGSAWVFFWLSLLIAGGCIGYGFKDPRFFWGGGLVLSALWYYLCIRWMDENDQW